MFGRSQVSHESRVPDGSRRGWLKKSWPSTSVVTVPSASDTAATVLSGSSPSRP